MRKKLTFTECLRLALIVGLSVCMIRAFFGASVPVDLIPLPILFLTILGIYKEPIVASRLFLVLGTLSVGHSLFYSHMYMTNPNIDKPYESMTSMWLAYTPLILILVGFLILACSKKKNNKHNKSLHSTASS